MRLLGGVFLAGATLALAPVRSTVAGHAVRRVDGAVRGGGGEALFVYAAVFGGQAPASDAAPHDALATQLWPAGRAAAALVASVAAAGDTVLEIGAGTALPSLAAAAAGADVLATDRDPTALAFAAAAAADQGLSLRTAVFDVEGADPLPPGGLVVLADTFVTDAVAAACARRVAEALERGSRVLVVDARRSQRDAFLAALGTGAFVPVDSADPAATLALVDAG